MLQVTRFCGEGFFTGCDACSLTSFAALPLVLGRRRVGVHGDVGLETALLVTGSKQSFGDALQRLDCPLQHGLLPWQYTEM